MIWRLCWLKSRNWSSSASDAAADDSGIGGQRRRIVGELVFEPLVKVRELVHFVVQRLQTGAPCSFRG